MLVPSKRCIDILEPASNLAASLIKNLVPPSWGFHLQKPMPGSGKHFGHLCAKLVRNPHHSQVCQSAHKRLIGIGSGVLQAMREGKPGFTMDEYRTSHPKHPTLGVSLRNSSSGKWQYILAFLWLLYVSEAEILPTKFKMPSEKVQKYHMNDEDFQERYVTAFLRDVDSQFALPRIEHLGPGSFAGPCRFLEYAQPIDIFYQYSAHEENDGRKPASLATFMKVFKKIFGTYLKFRDHSEHAQCNICGRLKGKIKAGKSKQQRLDFVGEYSRHVLSQWMDRQIYWKLRALSQRYFGTIGITQIQDSIYSSCLTAILDGMDQSKLRTPRFGYQRISKQLEALFRPTLHLTAAWLHGHKVWLPVSDESLKKDSQTQAEILSRALSDLCVSVATKQLPLGFHLQQDNCFREGKNKYIVSYCLLLVVVGAFRWSSTGFLRTGHSHEDVDQIFGQLSRLLKGKSFSTPEALIKLLRSAASRSSSQPAQIRGSQVCPYKLDEVACWKVFTQQLGLDFKGLRHLVVFIRFGVSFWFI